jgi:diadenosine tetraphosphate (Ap4A) HIT family hydrolase
VALRPDEFYDHALSAADNEGRLPLARMTGWDISPFEPDGLRVSPLRPPVVPEPARQGEDPAECRSCTRRDEGIWLDDRWRLTRIGGVGVPLVLMLHPRDHFDLADLPDALAAELGVLTTHIARHVEALPNVARAHVYRIGDGGAHLHVWFFARPAGQAQLYGSWLVVWDDLLPEYPEPVAQSDAITVATALADSYGGRIPGGP